MSSKKKKRRVDFIAREAKRKSKKITDEKYIEAIDSGDIEKMASVMGVKLK